MVDIVEILEIVAMVDGGYNMEMLDTVSVVGGGYSGNGGL